MREKTVQKMADTWRSVKPEPRQGSTGKATVRDTSNVALGGAVAMVVIWLLHDALGIHVPPEVGAAFGTIGGYLTGRLLRY